MIISSFSLNSVTMLRAFIIFAMSTSVPTLAALLRGEEVSVSSQTDADDNKAIAHRNMADTCTFQKHPYLLYPGEIPKMVVLFQLTCDQDVEIRWGLDENANYTDSAFTTKHADNLHSYTIQALEAGRKYKYQVLDQFGTFYAAPSSEATDIKFTVIGDTRSDIEVLDSVVKGMRDAYQRDNSFQSLALHVGDWVVDDSEGAWTNEWFKIVAESKNHRDFMRNVPFMGCRGNHEYGGTVFRKYYPYPYVGGKFYWSFDYGPMHVAVVDQYAPYHPESTQYEWLENDLSETDKKWKIIMLHEPGWHAGPKSNNKDVQRYIQPLCKKHGVQVVFAGHTHNYVLAVVDGVYHVDTSGGGVPMRPTGPGYPNVVHRADGNHHCEVEITGNRFELTAKAPNGMILHSFTYNHTIAPDYPTTDPSCAKVPNGGPFTIVDGGNKFYRGEFACYGSNKFGLTEEGRLVYMVGSTVVWEPSNMQDFADMLAMQKGGSLVARNAAGSVVWASNKESDEKLADSVAGSWLMVTSDGAEVVTPGNEVVWKLEIPEIYTPMPSFNPTLVPSSAVSGSLNPSLPPMPSANPSTPPSNLTPALTSTPSSMPSPPMTADSSCVISSDGALFTVVEPTDRLNRGEFACFGSSKFGLTGDGRIVFIVGTAVVWEPSNKNQGFSDKIVMQRGGALVARDSAGSVVWATNKKSNEKIANPVRMSRLFVRSDGAEVVTPGNEVVWRLEV